MRPLELYMEGLSAFRQAQTIDFRQFGELFAIIGETGAGKSTILDGMSIALFGRLPRANQHQCRAFVTLGATEAKIRFDFAVGGVEYRAARRLFAKDRPQIVSLHRRTADGWESEVLSGGVKEVDARIEQVLGFDYDAFTKAIVLPQGAFSDFLRGKPEHRSKLLARLLDCEKYERAGALAREKAKTANQQMEIREELLARDWSDATDDRHAEVVELAGRLRGRETMLRGLSQEVETALDRAAALRREGEGLARREALVSRAGENLRTLEEDCAGLAEADAATAEATLKAAEGLGNAQHDLKEGDDALKAALDAQGDEADLAELQAAAEAISQADQDAASITKQLEEAIGACGVAATAHEQASRAAREAADNVETARNGHQTARDNATAVREQIRVASEYTDAKKALESAQADLEQASGDLELAKRGLEDAKAVLAAAEAAHADTMTAHRAQALRSELHEGEPCPVCEQVVSHIPGPGPGHEDVQRAAKALQEARTTCGTEEDRERKAALAYAGLETAVGKAEDRLRRAGPEPRPIEPDALVKAETAESEAKAALDEALRQERGAGDRLTQASRDLSGAEAKRDGLAERKNELEARSQDGMRTLAPRFGDKPLVEVVAEVRAAQGELRRLRDAVQTARTSLEAASRASEAAALGRAAFENSVRSVGLRLVEIRGRIAAESAAAPIPAGILSEEEDGSHSAQVSQVVSLRTWCDSLSDELMASSVAAEQEAGDLEQGVRARFEEVDLIVAEEDSAPDRKDLDRAMEALGREIDSVAQRAARAESEAEGVAKRIAQRKQIEAEVAEFRASAERYGRLGLELKADRFVKFVLEESFQDLALRASDELRRVSSGRYSLNAEGYDFQVVDHANADECRSVVTLSGGESFLASLSLALAFAGSIRDLAGDALGTRLESVFIDEGFGMLDADTLDVVAEGLERVQEERRMVGIITHVPTMAERIPSGLLVEKGPTGSTVRVRSDGD